MRSQGLALLPGARQPNPPAGFLEPGNGQNLGRFGVRDSVYLFDSIGRGSWIRTNDLQYPKLPRYQAALYPDHWDRDVDTRSQRRQQGAAEPSAARAPMVSPAPIALVWRCSLVRMQAGRSRLGMDLGRHHAL